MIRDNRYNSSKRMQASRGSCDYTPLELLCPGFTYGLAVGVTHMDVKGSVGGVDKRLAPGAVVLIAFLHCAGVPVGPVHSVLKHSYGKRMREHTIIHSVAVMAI